MKSLDAVFIFFDMSGKCIYHLGMAYVIAKLKSHGFHAKFYILDSYLTMDEIAMEIREMNPKCIGFSLYDTNFQMVTKLAKVIGEKSQDNVTIIAGGPTATFSTEKVLKFVPEIDVCVRYAGEAVMLQLIEHIVKQKNYHHLKGISYRDGNGKFVHNQEDFFNPSLDTYPSPYLDGTIDIIKCQKVNEMINIVTSRGCAFKCRYCNFAAIGRYQICFHSVDRVMEELRTIYHTGRKANVPIKIDFMDDIFTINRERTIELCNRIIKENLILDFGCQTRADCVDDEMLDLLYQAGCRRIFYGLESGVPRILNDMGKIDYEINEHHTKEKIFIEKMKEATNLSVKKGIDTTVNMIFGWKGETEQEAMESLRMVESLKPTHYSHSALMHYAGTEIYQKAVNEHKQKIEQWEEMNRPILNFNYHNFPELYEYNPYSLPHLRNDLYRFIMTHRRSIIQTIMGIGLKNDEVPQTLLVNQKDMDFSWLTNHFTTRSKIAIFDDEKSDSMTFYFPIRSFADECYDGTSYSMLHNAETVVKKYLLSGADAFHKEYGKHMLIDLKNADDMKQFFTHLEAIRTSKLVKSCSFDSDDYMLINYCRWFGRGCPAIGLKRMMVKDGYVHTCFKGKPVIEVDSFEINEVRKRIHKMYDDACKERKCVECDLYASCPKCLCLDEFGKDAYCEMQHKMRDIKNMRKMYSFKMTEYFYQT